VFTRNVCPILAIYVKSKQVFGQSSIFGKQSDEPTREGIQPLTCHVDDVLNAMPFRL